jgi:protein phosphatase
MVIVESSGITDVGRRRKGNEDSLLVDDDMGLYVVADGMGGHQAGEVASRIVVDILRDYMKTSHEEKDEHGVTDIDETLSKAANRIISGIYLANRTVYQLSLSKESYQGMGSTVSVVYFTENTLVAANVGDSPIYLIRNDAIETLFVPHTMMAEHAAMAPKGAKPLGKQYRHMLTRAMGVKETVKPDSSEIQVFKGDILVISSDGLSDKVSPEEILDIVNKQQPDDACRVLVDLANERGGEDNITIIVLNIKDLVEDGFQPIPEDGIDTEVETSTAKPQIVVEYDTEDGSYRSLVQHISVDGVFIETGESFYVGQEILLAFSVGDDGSSFMVNGKVANRRQEGIDVKFENLTPQLQEMIKSLEEKI